MKGISGNSYSILLCSVLAALLGMACQSQAGIGRTDPYHYHPPYAPETLPGKNLAEHDLLVYGENDQHRMEQTISMVRYGRVVWTYSIPRMEHGEFQEIGDAYMLPNGNILFARQHGVTIVNPKQEIVWNFDAPKDENQTTYFPRNSEIHAVEPAGPDRVMFVINQTPKSKLMIVNTKTNAIEKTVELPTPKEGVHLHFRRVHITPTGTILAAHLDEGKIAEYDMTGNELWSLPMRSPWAVSRLANGNTLVAGNGVDGTYLRELNTKHEVVWEYSKQDEKGIELMQMDDMIRLANGNTLVANWCAFAPPADYPQTVQEIEVTPGKEIVWALRSWTPPNDLGTVSGVRLLDRNKVVAKLYPD